MVSRKRKHWNQTERDHTCSYTTDGHGQEQCSGYRDDTFREKSECYEPISRTNGFRLEGVGCGETKSKL